MDMHDPDTNADPPAAASRTTANADPPATASRTEAPAATLCRRCGLCCDGNLFAQVPLSADEAASARRHALVVIDRDDGTPALRQRCAALGPRGCAVYDERPAGCRRYRCMLLAALADDEVSLPAALAVVAEAHALLAAADAALPAPVLAATDAALPAALLAAADAALPAPVLAAADAAPPTPVLAAADATLPAPPASGPTATLQRAREAARGDTLTPAARAAVHATRVFLARHLDRGAGPR